MQIYNYDRLTGVYVGTSQADPNPEVEGEFLIPAFATTIAPPAVTANFDRVFDGTKWVYREQDASEDDPVPNNQEPSNDFFVNAIRDQKLADGLKWHGVWYQTDKKAIANITGASVGATVALMTGAQPGNLRWADADSDFGWIATDNSITPMDAQTMIAFGQSAMAYVFKVTFAARTIKDRINNGISPPSIMYDDSFWPSNEVPDEEA